MKSLFLCKHSHVAKWRSLHIGREEAEIFKGKKMPLLISGLKYWIMISLHDSMPSTPCYQSGCSLRPDYIILHKMLE